MSTRKPKKIKFNLEKIFKKKKSKAATYLLEKGTLTEMRAAKEWTAKLLDFHWRFYSELAYQRNQNLEALKEAILIQSTSNFEFTNWQRAVKYKFSLHPLSVVGSLNYVGGRFNSGTEINSQIPAFGCLYISLDKETSIQEALCQDSENKSKNFTPLEFALTNSQSETFVSVSGKLDKVFDLRKKSNLKKLVAVFKKFKISKELTKLANEIYADEPELVKSEQLLLDSILERNWRNKPVQFDIPSNSQIFGYLAYLAGVDGIIYPSKYTGKVCLAIFPKNFENGDSFIKLDDAAPHAKVPGRIDGKSWRLSELTFEEISNSGGIVH